MHIVYYQTYTKSKTRKVNIADAFLSLTNQLQDFKSEVEWFIGKLIPVAFVPSRLFEVEFVSSPVELSE